MTPTNTDHTHRAERQSWVESANAASTDFPLQNLPYGVFLRDHQSPARLGVAIGDQILDLSTATEQNLLPADLAPVCRQATLNGLLAAGPAVWTALRGRLSELLGADTCPPTLRSRLQPCLVPQNSALMQLPAAIGGYTDFYASIHHATNVGALFRPDQPLLPNYKWVPIGYHGRTSSLIPSGTPVRRPHGQHLAPGGAVPAYAPTGALDYEVELGALVGPGNPRGETIGPGRAGSHLFGVVLLNDWSARDIQSWEYQPLGPFLSKNFATSLSPWVVTLEALAPFRVPPAPRAAGDPAPLPHLADAGDAVHGGLDLTLEAWLLTARMRATGSTPHRLSSGNFRDMYWTLAQLLAHHTSNGCNLQPGDLLGSGTVSGPAPGSRGCLLEITRRGAEPLALPDGEIRRYLEDGDEIILRGFAERPGFRRIGLGECRGVVLPAGR